MRLTVVRDEAGVAVAHDDLAEDLDAVVCHVSAVFQMMHLKILPV